MWDFSFMIPCAFMLFTILGFYLSRPRLPIRGNRVFVVLLLVELLVMVVDILAMEADEFYTQLPVWLVYAANVLYFALYLLRAYWFYYFEVHVIQAVTSASLSRERIMALPFFVSEVICLSSFFTNAFFSIGPQGYARGPFYDLLYVIGAFYIAASLVLTIRYRKYLRKNEFLLSIGFNCVLIVGNVIRFAFPKLLSMDTFCTMAIAIIFLGYMNPELFLFEQGEDYNAHAFRVYLSEVMVRGSYHVLGIALQNYNGERGLLGGQQMDAAVMHIGRWLAAEFPDCVSFYLDSGRFALVSDDDTNWSHMSMAVRRRFQQPWETPSGTVTFNVAFASASDDSGLKTADEIMNMLALALDVVQQDVGYSADVAPGSMSIKEVDRQVDVMRALERALVSNEVEVFFQPVYDSETRQIVAAEALARIRNDKDEYLSPALFIPMAERSGYINQLGEQVVDKTCAFIASNDMRALGIRWINVNLSPVQCMQQDLAARFLEILARHEVSADQIHLEITEQSIGDSPLLQQQVRALHEANFAFSLDDYGAGYSNLTRVRQYPFSNIKLDMGIVWDYCRERDSLLPAMVKGFRDTGYTITAEGIETEEMAEALTAIGSDYLQGYLFSKPLEPDAFLLKYGS